MTLCSLCSEHITTDAARVCVARMTRDQAGSLIGLPIRDWEYYHEICFEDGPEERCWALNTVPDTPEEWEVHVCGITGRLLRENDIVYMLQQGSMLGHTFVLKPMMRSDAGLVCMATYFLVSEMDEGAREQLPKLDY